MQIIGTVIIADDWVGFVADIYNYPIVSRWIIGGFISFFCLLILCLIVHGIYKYIKEGEI